MILAIIFLIVGLVLLVFSADYVMKGAVSLAAFMGISAAVVGLTVAAFGTSAPVLAVSMSASKGQVDLAVGNVIGSNIFNILVTPFSPPPVRLPSPSTASTPKANS